MKAYLLVISYNAMIALIITMFFLMMVNIIEGRKLVNDQVRNYQARSAYKYKVAITYLLAGLAGIVFIPGRQFYYDLMVELLSW